MEIQDLEADGGDDGLQADFSALGKAGGRTGGRTGGRLWLFKCFGINIGGRSLAPKPQRNKLSAGCLFSLS